MKKWVLVLGVLAMAGCVRTMQDIDELPNDHKGAKVFYSGRGDEIAVGGGKGVHYERNF